MPNAKKSNKDDDKSTQNMQEDKHEDKDELKDKMQYVILYFDDGSQAVFAGAAAIEPGESKKVISLAFSIPKPLPENYRFGKIEEQ